MSTEARAEKIATADEWVDWIRANRDPDIDELLTATRRDGKPYRVVVACDCDYEGCMGWGVVPPPYDEDERASAIPEPAAGVSESPEENR